MVVAAKIKSQHRKDLRIMLTLVICIVEALFFRANVSWNIVSVEVLLEKVLDSCPGLLSDYSQNGIHRGDQVLA